MIHLTGRFLEILISVLAIIVFLKPADMILTHPITLFLLSKKFRISLLLILTLVTGIQILLTDSIANLVIFRTASERLFHQQNLYDYIQYKIIWDKFFYAPVFAFLFYPFAALPISVSVFLWLLLDAVFFYFALEILPLSATQKTIIFFIALSDLINSFQNLQTNAINTAFMLFIFIFLHHHKYVFAAIMCGSFV